MVGVGELSKRIIANCRNQDSVTMDLYPDFPQRLSLTTMRHIEATVVMMIALGSILLVRYMNRIRRNRRANLLNP